MKTTKAKVVRFLLVGMICLWPLVPAEGAPPTPLAPPVPLYPGAVVAPNFDVGALSAIFNTNLIPDGDAEVPYGSYWHDNEGFTQIVAYGADCSGHCNYPSPYDVGPTQRGNRFFYMGTTANHVNGNNLWLNNEISVSQIQAAIDAGRVRYILSGYFGGDSNKTDTAQLHVFFETSTHTSTGEAIVGNVTPAERQNKTGLLYRQIIGFLPAHTAYINLALQSGQLSGSDYRTGYADNLSLILIPVTVYLPLMQRLADQLPAQTGYPPPSGVFVSPNGLTRMDIYWTDNSYDELGFEVQRINADNSVDTVCNTPPKVTYCLDPGVSQSAPYGYVFLGSNTAYTYQVRAVGPGVNSAWASGTGTTATEPLTPPSPTHGSFTCQAIDVASTSATFVWNDPFNYEAGFNIYLGSNSYPSWSMMERGTKIAFINQVPGTITLRMVPFVFDRTNPSVVYESSTSCTATAILLAATSRTYFHNNASYPVISLVVDGWEQFPVRPLSILPGAYYELDGVSLGQHTWTATTGFWDDWGQRFSMYTYSGSFTQPSSGSNDVYVPDMTIQDLLSVPPANLGYWEGYYFDAGGHCSTAAFMFQPNGAYTFYNANTATDTGTYSLVARKPAIFSTKFHVTGSQQNMDGLLVETQGQFSMKNGPASWQEITYVYKPRGYVRNPFCP